ncbi:hypothetical protein [Mycobacterium sp. shizuoka-1]|uniref:beta strand repeat-containing protein n=1 Tax=Mycobacterium sp. shizuoka-1 TaxID=2039281 RepID=UPI000C06718A|nr:hypothetical protein [Mycobacterium sp. shizuoka-1]GAY14341.1 hypothetical protein MSZK_10670 [Mycobacterium sp. shizuoka-1]
MWLGIGAITLGVGAALAGAAGTAHADSKGGGPGPGTSAGSRGAPSSAPVSHRVAAPMRAKPAGAGQAKPADAPDRRAYGASQSRWAPTQLATLLVDTTSAATGREVDAGGTARAYSARLAAKPTTDQQGAAATPTPAPIGTPLKLAGTGGAQFNSDGTRALITTTALDPANPSVSINRTVLVNTATGAQLGVTVKLAGTGFSQFNLAGTRALISAYTSDPANPGNYLTQAVLIDTATGAQLGASVKVAGGTYAQFDPGGNRVLVSAYASDPAHPGHYVTRAVLVDAATGAQVGATAKLPGAGFAQFAGDGTRLLLSAYDFDAADFGYTTRAVLLDTSTGGQLGATVKLAGAGNAGFATGTSPRATVTATGADPVTGTPITRVVVLDTGTGAQVGATLKLTGNLITVSSNSARTLVATKSLNAPNGTVTSRIVVLDTATGAQVGATTKMNMTLPHAAGLSGFATGFAQLSSDGSRVLFSTYFLDAGDPTNQATQSVLIDTATGAQLGVPVQLAGTLVVGRAFSIDDARALLVTNGKDAATGTYLTRVVVLNTANGAQIGSTVKMANAGVVGVSASSQQFNLDGSRAVVSTVAVDAATGAYTNRTVLINTVTGAQVGAPVQLAGKTPSSQFSNDGARALISSRDQDGTTGAYTTRVVLLNTATGAQLGPTVKLPGAGSAWLLGNDRALVSTTAPDPVTGAPVTRAVVIDVATGSQLGTTVRLDGSGGFDPSGTEGTRAVVFTSVADVATNTYKTLRLAIDVATGAQIGSTVELPGSLVEFQVSTDGARTFVVTTAPTSAVRPWTTQVIVLDTATGVQIGSTLTIAGGAGQWATFSGFMTRALIGADATSATGTVTTTTLLRIT